MIFQTWRKVLIQDINFKMQLFYLPEIKIEKEIQSFGKDESRHLHKVLRKSVGDEINITNGKNKLFRGEITLISKNNCEFKILNSINKNSLPYSLHIGISILKSNERFEWFLEKSSEIGITEITPLICDRTQQKYLKLNRLEKILISGMKQSLKTFLPKLNPPTALNEFINQNLNGNLFVAHCNQGEKKPLLKLIEPNSKNTLLIGPEGDFTPKEIKLCNDKKFRDVSLGETRLRAETAGIVACHTFSIANM